MKKIIRISLRAATGGLLLLTLATGLATSTPGAAEASPAPVLRALPNASDSLFVLPCGSSGFPTTAGLVDVATGTITGRGGPVVLGACFNNGDYDATTKTSYVIDFTGATRILSTFDPLTGVVTPIAEFFEGSPTNLRNPLALAISATGAAYASGNDHELYRVNLATAEMTPVGDAPPLGLYSFDFNPIDGLLYAISFNAGGVYTINPADGVETLVGPYPASASAGLQFDSAGVAWFQNNEVSPRLFSATDMTHLESSQVLQGAFMFGSERPYIESLLYVPASAPDTAAGIDAGIDAPVLAATGILGSGTERGAGGFVALGFDALSFGALSFGATVAILAGGVLVMVRHRWGWGSGRGRVRS